MAPPSNSHPFTCLFLELAFSFPSLSFSSLYNCSHFGYMVFCSLFCSWIFLGSFVSLPFLPLISSPSSHSPVQSVVCVQSGPFQMLLAVLSLISTINCLQTLPWSSPCPHFFSFTDRNFHILNFRETDH